MKVKTIVKKTYIDMKNQEPPIKLTITDHKPSGKDNNGAYIGNRLSFNKNKIRYPSKKRSRQVWKRFYELFPYQAILDGWDGKTSKRFK
jgi:hypothetical protein